MMDHHQQHISSMQASVTDTMMHNTDVNVEIIVKLVNTLYHSNIPEQQTEASKRLTELQHTDEIWPLCWLMLNPSNNYPPEVHFYAANVVVLKINHNWWQQDQEWLEEQLRPKLLETLARYASSPAGTKLVIERLSLALANFALHSILTFWPNAIEEIIQSFTSSNLPFNIPEQRICDILLKILVYIPEEYSVMLPQQEHRATLNGQISNAGPLVFKFLNSLLVADKNATTIECKQNILKCLTSWTLHSQTSIFELDDGKIILDNIYNLIGDDELCSNACTTLAASFSSQKADNFKNTIIEFIPKLAHLKQLIDSYRSINDIESSIKIYSLVINFSENHSRLFLKIVLNDGIQLEAENLELTKQSIFTILRIILDCTAAPGVFGADEKYSEIAFPFWFTFFENFCYYQDCYSDVICDTFDPLVDSLLQILITKAQYPPAITYHESWNDDQREAFRCFRQDLGDNISLIVHFPRARKRVTQQLHDQLSQEIDQYLQYGSRPEDNLWQKLEATIFAIKALAEATPFDEKTYIPKIFDLVARIPYSDSPTELYCTAAEMISSYADWLYNHGDHLGTAFTVLFLGVTSVNADARLMSTLALKDITSECQSTLRPYATSIVKSCTEAILEHSQILNTNEKSRIMHSLGATLAVTNYETVSAAINTLAMPLIFDLNAKAQVDPSTDLTSRTIILDRLAMLNSLVESLYIKDCSTTDYEDADENDLRINFEAKLDDFPEHSEAIQPAIRLLKQIIPILTDIASRYKADEEVIDLISNTVKRSAKSLGIELKPILQDLLSIILNSYDPILTSNLLDGVAPLYMIFKVDESAHDILLQAFHQVTEKTLNVCLQNQLGQLCVTVENFFKFVTCVCRKFPEFLTNTQTPINVEFLCKLAIACLEMPEKRTLSEICRFLTLLRQKSAGVEHLHRIFFGNLELLLNNIFNIYGGNFTTPRCAMETVIDLMYFITDASEARSVLNLVVERDNFPNGHITKDQKTRFVNSILHERNRRKYKDICLSFVSLLHKR